MKKLKAALIVLAFCGLSSCGSSCNDLSYQFNEGGCDTGIHSFDDQNAYCAALKDDQINHGCAWIMRDQQYQQDCQ